MPQVAWSIAIERDGECVASVGADQVLRTASMGKVFLLIEVARQIAQGSLDPALPLSAVASDRVTDSGLWQHFDEVPLTVSAAAVLVASVSDNLATNVLLDHLGLAAVQSVSAALGIPQTAMLDRIRDVRGPEHAIAPSVGRAADLAGLMGRLAGGDLLEPAGTQVRRWLALGVDLSMVASAFGLDPLAHADAPMGLFNKTGTDAGVRADAGAFQCAGHRWSYALIANWPGTDEHQCAKVLDAMRLAGQAVREAALA